MTGDIFSVTSSVVLKAKRPKDNLIIIVVLLSSTPFVGINVMIVITQLACAMTYR